jgi:hypothetical protein
MRVAGTVLCEGYATENGELAWDKPEGCIYAMERV